MIKNCLNERDIVIVFFDMDSAASKIKKWHIDTPVLYTFILVGKDGGEKLRSNSMVSLKKAVWYY